jgi:pimeloyl-ACP methyl ester carboxylesterase
MPLYQSNGQWIHYEDTGGNLPPVVLAHGFLMDHEMFTPQIEALGSERRIIAWDARCHGKTETTDDPFTYWDLADDLRGLLDHLGIGRAVIGGMGQGGFIALRFALNHPDRVSALILLSTEAGPEHPDKVATYEATLDMWEAAGWNAQMAETIAAILFGTEWSGREPWIAKWQQIPRSLLRPAFKALVGRDDIHDRLGQIKAPALVIHGTADAAIDIARAERLCSGLANCQPLVTIGGGGHACNLTHPELVNLAVLQYLLDLAPRMPRAAERRRHDRRTHLTRRIGERRYMARAGGDRRVLFPVERRVAERRTL